MTKPFNPKWGSNQVLAAANPAAAVVIDADNTCETVSVTNSLATNKGYVRTYNSKNAGTPPVASAIDLVVVPGQTRLITKPYDHDSLSYFSAAGTTLEVMVGNNGV